jgi:hypothetical protein
MVTPDALFTLFGTFLQQALYFYSLSVSQLTVFIVCATCRCFLLLLLIFHCIFYDFHRFLRLIYHFDFLGLFFSFLLD